MGYLQVVIFTLGVAIQCAGLFYVCKGLGGGTRSRYYTSEYHELTYVYIYCYWYVTIHVFILVLSYLAVAEISMQILIYCLSF